MANPILLYTRDIESAKAEIAAEAGHVTQIFTPSLLEAILPDGFSADRLQASSPEPSFDLDETTSMLANAWRNIEVEAAVRSTAPEASDEASISWDDPRFQPPGKIDEPPPFPDDRDGAELRSTGTPTSLRMVGSVTVGLVVVSGSTDPSLQFSGAEQSNVVQQVMQGLQFLAASAPLGNLTFVYDTHFLTVNAPPPTTPCASYESCEKVWRDPALTQLGYQTGYSGCVDYADALKQNHNTNWSYVAFFTKYPQYHFAYAGGVRLCMQYANDGWGPGQIDRVFAHETCHIFGAADEYGNCGCGPSGELNVPNNNCKNCTTSQVACLMNANTFALCTWSRGQIGWWPRVAASMGAINVDGGRPYVFATGDDGNLWVNWWSGSAWDWSNQGLPAGTSIASSMGAITVDGGRPYVFVKSGDGNLWVNWWSDSAWGWSNQGLPAGTSIASSMGAITVDGGRPYIFVTGSDGNLWVNWWSGTAWGWSNQGQPPGASIASSMGATTVDGGRPYVFVTGSDGNLWVNWWSGTAWGWSNQGKPPGASIGSSMGAITVDGGRPYVFVTGSDGNLWVNWWSGTAWGWSNQGRPTGLTINASMGAITVDGGRPYVFVKCNDGNLWVNWWSGTAWGWNQQIYS